MPTPKLPKTIARLSTSVTIRLIPEDTLNAATLANPAAILTAVQNAPIGAVESFQETNSRPAVIRFEMNAAAPGLLSSVRKELSCTLATQLRHFRLMQATSFSSSSLSLSSR